MPEISNMRTVTCHDCGKPVSLSARACPVCGSREPAGPVRSGRRAPRKIDIERLNDRNLAVTSLALGLLGACYGFATSTGAMSAIFFTALYGFVGVSMRADRLCNQPHSALKASRTAFARPGLLSTAGCALLFFRWDHSQCHLHPKHWRREPKSPPPTDGFGNGSC
jgi:hypothetical protein